MESDTAFKKFPIFPGTSAFSISTQQVGFLFLKSYRFLIYLSRITSSIIFLFAELRPIYLPFTLTNNLFSSEIQHFNAKLTHTYNIRVAFIN